MAKKRFGLDFSGIADLAEKYDKLGGDLKEITTKALEFIPEEINPEAAKAIATHRRSGKTASSLVQDQKVSWNGTVATIAVGFDLKSGGFPSIYLMYGTARHAPSNQYGGPYNGGTIETQQVKQLYDAFYGNRTQKKISEEQQKIFLEEVEKIMGG